MIRILIMLFYYQIRIICKDKELYLVAESPDQQATHAAYVSRQVDSFCLYFFSTKTKSTK